MAKKIRIGTATAAPPMFGRGYGEPSPDPVPEGDMAADGYQSFHRASRGPYYPWDRRERDLKNDEPAGIYNLSPGDDDT